MFRSRKACAYHSLLYACTGVSHILCVNLTVSLILEPDPQKNSKEGLGDKTGVEVYRVPGMQAHFQLVHDCMPTRVYWKYTYTPQTTSIVQGDRKYAGSAGERSCWSIA